VIETIAPTLPPDQAIRERSLDHARSVLVQAPAGSGKTDLLTRRFLRLLSTVDDPAHIVAITFTRDAAAEMRHRILAELEKASDPKAGNPAAGPEPFSTQALAAQALARSRERGWNLLELPAQLRISTIDAFCREVALQQPLLSGLGGSLDIAEDPVELYRRAARRTLLRIDTAEPELRSALEKLLLWRDNGWQDMENLLVKMLAQRDRWMQGFVFGSEQESDLRERLERPFARAVRDKLIELNELLDRCPRARGEAHQLARFACEQTAGKLHRELAELADFPEAPYADVEALEQAREACACLANLLQTKAGEWRLEKGLNATVGFPATDPGRAAKKRLSSLIANLDSISGFQATLAAIANLPPARYTEDDWQIVRACFALLRQAAAELKVVFAEAGVADYVEVAQIAQAVLGADETGPVDAARAIADGIRHLLVDEFQDTSRRQHELLRNLIGAWPDRETRTCFVVGDPMQSIYFFRDADAELFPRVKANGLEIAGAEPLSLDVAELEANFRTAPGLVRELNEVFAQVFAAPDGSGVTFAEANPARRDESAGKLHLVENDSPRLALHLDFMPRAASGAGRDREQRSRLQQERHEAHARQIDQVIDLIRGHLKRVESARAKGERYRIAVLGRTRAALAPIAKALRDEAIPFRGVDLEALKDRPEVLDALALARALLNPHDRVAWLGVLRAPWCGLSLADLHLLASADDAEVLKRPVPSLLDDRAPLLSEQGRAALRRLQPAVESAARLRDGQPSSALGTWLEQVWLRLGGAACVTAAQRANLDLLWQCLDGLPAGEQDVLGTALDAALNKLMALPDPDADSECGVQLMTIHKSKGLEFEVVMVPELQAATRGTRTELLSWMERGLTVPDESGEITEFLVAPIQAKGDQQGRATRWVDRARKERESQEMRRLLYVAATRAREELHLFARPQYKIEANGVRTLADLSECLLKTAWPALDDEIQRRFEQWKVSRGDSGIVQTLAAAADFNTSKDAVLRRLPADFSTRQISLERPALSAATVSAGQGRLYRRHEGGLVSRVLGIAVHGLLQELARLRVELDWPAARVALAESQPQVVAQARASGIELEQATRIAAEALALAIRASEDDLAQWILAPHPGAASEARWAGVLDGEVRVVQVDRVFQAGPIPASSGTEVWWIVDYKTAHADAISPDSALPELRKLFAPQLELYARVLRGLHGEHATVRAGLYYPRMLKFDWWEL
jgi:ATP-dependent helicase/nuclease subunit A